MAISSKTRNSIFKRAVCWLIALAGWFAVGAPLVHGVTWRHAEREVAALEAAGERDDRVSPVVVYSTIRRWESEAARQENLWTVLGMAVLCFVANTIEWAWRRRAQRTPWWT